MGPCTFLVTAAVTGGKHVSVFSKASEVWASKGIKGFYPGGTAIAFRQATNWASRQGFTEAVREQFKVLLHDGDKTAKLSVAQEAWAGIIGGALSCWNHPFVSIAPFSLCLPLFVLAACPSNHSRPPTSSYIPPPLRKWHGSRCRPRPALERRHGLWCR